MLSLCLAPKTSHHCLRDYGLARRIWCTLNFDMNEKFFSYDLYGWLKEFSLGNSTSLFLATFWCIWCARNEFIFENKCSHPSSNHAFSTTSTHRSSIAVSWHRPPPHFIKVNIDRSSFANPERAGFGGVLRSSSDEWICRFSSHVSRADNLCVEFLDLRKGVQIAWLKGFRQVLCEVDY